MAAVPLAVRPVAAAIELWRVAADRVRPAMMQSVAAAEAAGFSTLGCRQSATEPGPVWASSWGREDVERVEPPAAALQPRRASYANRPIVMHAVRQPIPSTDSPRRV